jgi:hypothetical protein
VKVAGSIHAGDCPTVGAGIVPTATIQIGSVSSTPNDHLAAGPHCRVMVSSSRHVRRASRCPTISAGNVSPTSVQKVIGAIKKIPAPDDHFAPGPHCRVTGSYRGRIGRASRCPTIGARIVSLAGVQIVGTIVLSAPDDHFAAGPHCRVTNSGRPAAGAGGRPTVGAGIVSPTGVENEAAALSAPDDHLAPGPHCSMKESGSGRVSGADGCPTIGTGIVPAASVQITSVSASAPDDHFTARPDCRVTPPGSGRVGGADGCPTIDVGIIPPARVQTVDAPGISAPDDHFAASPNCRVVLSSSGRVSGASWSPRVVNALRSAFRSIARTLGAEKSQQCPSRQQKQVKRASKKVRFSRRRILFSHKPGFASQLVSIIVAEPALAGRAFFNLWPV